MKKKQEANFDNVIDFSEYADKATKNKKSSTKINREAEYAAQMLVYDAWEEGNKRKRIKLAKRALLIFPDCADAYNLLAEEAAKSPEEVKGYYHQGMEAGRRALGEKIFKEGSGGFWGMLETRPYMRSLAGLMQCLWKEGKHDEAIKHARELLKLNPNDNQGIRYILISYLAELGNYDDLDKFMNKGNYKYDWAAEWLYTKALLAFVKNGGTPRAKKALSVALERNSHVPEYLTGKKKIPSVLPDSIMMGGDDEAYCYAADNSQVWKNVPGALEWLKTQLGKTGRGVSAKKVSREDYK